MRRCRFWARRRNAPASCAAWRNLICKQDPTPATAGEAEKARIKNGRGQKPRPICFFHISLGEDGLKGLSGKVRPYFWG